MSGLWSLVLIDLTASSGVQQKLVAAERDIPELQGVARYVSQSA